MRTTALVLLVALLPLGAHGAPRAVCASGTSLTNGYVFDATPYPARLAILAGVPVVNFGVNGDRLASIVSRWRKYAKPFPYRVLVAEGGTNDLAQDAATGTVLWLVFQAWLEEAHSWDPDLLIVLVTVPPRSDIAWTPTMETQRQAFNSAAVTYASTRPWVILVNSDLLLGNGASPPELVSGYRCEDKLHLCATGMQTLAQEVYDLTQ